MAPPHRRPRSCRASTWLGAMAERTTGPRCWAPACGADPPLPPVNNSAGVCASLACLGAGSTCSLGVGHGRGGSNETSATGADFPAVKEHRMRLAEAIKLMRALWVARARGLCWRGKRKQENSRRRYYNLPDEPAADFVAASGPVGGEARGPCRRRLRPRQWQEARALRESWSGRWPRRTGGRWPGSGQRCERINRGRSCSSTLSADYARDTCRWWAALLSLTHRGEAGHRGPDRGRAGG